MVQVHTCVSVHCDQCGDGLGSPGFAVHYPTEDTALHAATAQGWLAGPGRRWWCSACGPVLNCEAEGHQFSDWHEPQGDRGRPGERVYRYCRRCCLHEGRALVLSGAQLAGEVA